MAVDPRRIYDMARTLANDVLALVDHVPAEWDGGDLGYMWGATTGLAAELLDALPDQSITKAAQTHSETHADA